MNRLATLIISVYIAAFLYTNVFFVKTLTLVKSSGELFWNYFAIFLILLVPIYFLVGKVISIYHGRGSMRHIRLILLAMALTGLVISLFYHLIPLEPIYDLPAPIDRLFASETAFTLWLIIPLLALFI